MLALRPCLSPPIFHRIRVRFLIHSLKSRFLSCNLFLLNHTLRSSHHVHPTFSFRRSHVRRTRRRRQEETPTFIISLEKKIPAFHFNPKTADSPPPETVDTPQEPAKPELLNVGPASKIRNVSSREKIAELKKQVPQLKKKPVDINPNLIACWDKGEPEPFLFLCLSFDMIAEETGRIVITDIVCNMLGTVIYYTPEDLVPVVYLSANRIAPAHEGLELGIGDASIIKALAEGLKRRLRISTRTKAIWV